MLNKNVARIFNRYANRYDSWFDIHKVVFESELLCIKNVIPNFKTGLEIGIGTGRFASRLGIKIGIDPSVNMVQFAAKRGIEVIVAVAEDLPFKDSSFELVLISTTLCFVNDPIQTIKEANRVLTPKGNIIIAMIDKNSFLGKSYSSKKNKFYKYANFLSVSQVISWLKEMGFKDIKVYQTIFKDPKAISSLEPIAEGYGKGGFVVIRATCEKSLIKG